MGRIERSMYVIALAKAYSNQFKRNMIFTPMGGSLENEPELARMQKYDYSNEANKSLKSAVKKWNEQTKRQYDCDAIDSGDTAILKINDWNDWKQQITKLCKQWDVELHYFINPQDVFSGSDDYGP